MSRPFGYALEPAGLELQFRNDAEQEDDAAARDAVEAFVTRNGDALFDAIEAALQTRVTAMEEESAREAASRDRRTREANAEAMQAYYGDEEEEVEDEMADLFDDPEDLLDEEEDDEDEDDEPFHTRYTLQTVWVHGPESFGISGACDWDPEHGVGVRLQGLEVVGIGPASDAFA